MYLGILLVSFLFLGKGELLDTGSDFPSHIHISKDEHIFILDKTGSTEKDGLYAIAHYLQGAMDAPERVILVQIFTDGDVKEFLIDWKQNLTSKQLQKEFKNSFSKALFKAEIQENKAHIDTFLGFFDEDVKIGDQMRILWMPKGELQVLYGTTQKGKIESIPFAKAVWKIWLGQNSIVQKSLLVDEYIHTESFD